MWSGLDITLRMECGPREPIPRAGIHIDISSHQHGTAVWQRYTGLKSIASHHSRANQSGIQAGHVKTHLPRISLRGDLPCQLGVTTRQNSQHAKRSSQGIDQAGATDVCRN